MMIPYLIQIPPEAKNKDGLQWLLRTGVAALNLRHVRVEQSEHPEFETVSVSESIRQSALFNISLAELLQRPAVFSDRGLLLVDQREDPLYTAFYLINCIQEYSNEQCRDPLGRYQYNCSYQKKFENGDQNVVTQIFENIFEYDYKNLLRNRVFEKSAFFLTHDIDSLYGAFLQDGLAALKKGRIDVIARIILNTLFLRPDWFNIDKIVKIENEYDVKSCFFWLVNKGRVNKLITNSDYSLKSKKVLSAIRQIAGSGAEIGLHKSVSDETFDQELSKLPHKTIINRNHYLKLQLPEHFDAIENSNLQIDCSLGFAEQFGFRNSLAIPFIPFNVKSNKPYSFLEVPLNIMDGTFQKYMNVSPKKTSRLILEFIENNRVNSVISVLWHNHFFSSFRFEGYFEPYHELLDYMKEQQFPTITSAQLYKKYHY
jgi:hypothetical protein